MFKKQISRCWILFLVSAIGLVLTTYTSMGQVRFEGPINLSDNSIDSWNPDITAVDDQALVFWLNQVPGRSDVRLAHSRDNGKTFRLWHLSPGIQYPYHPKVVADGDNIYVGFPGFISSDPASTGIFLSRSTDGGETFLPPFDLSGRGSFNTPIMHVQDGILNVAWGDHDRASGSPGIVFSKSTDFGKTFSEPLWVSFNPRGLETDLLEMALDGDQIYLAWMSRRIGLTFYEIFFARSTDGGKTFCKPINLSQSTQEQGHSQDPQLAIGNKGSVYTAWAQGVQTLFLPSLDIYFARSTDGGKTFGERLNLSNDPEASNRAPRMVTAGDNLYVVWSGIVGGSFEVLFSRSTDGGKTFSKPQNISHNPRGAANAEIVVIPNGNRLDECLAEDIVYLVWQGGAPPRGSAVFFSVSLDSGATFSEPENISNTQGYSSGPRMAAIGRNIYITWMDNAPGHWSPFFVRGHVSITRPLSQCWASVNKK